MAFIKDNEVYICPECGEELRNGVIKCKNCGFVLTHSMKSVMKKEKKINESHQEKRTAAISAMKSLGLSNLTDDEENINSIIRIMSNLQNTSKFEMGALLSGKGEDFIKFQSYFLKSIYEQNFIIIRQLNEILKAIDNANTFTDV